MTKSNGIKSLKQAAKLLNKHSPDGESLAYINPKEARLLKAHGGSGIMTVAGVPSYFDWGNLLDLGKKYIPKVLDYGQKALDLFSIGKPAGASENDQRSTMTEYSDPYWQTPGINPNAPLPPNLSHDTGASQFTGENPFWKDIGGSIMKSGKDFLTGRYGGGEGIKNIAKDAFSVWSALKAKKDQEGLNNAEMEQFNKLNQQMLEHTAEFKANIAGGGVTNQPTDVTDVASFTDVTLPEMITTAVAEGGRIGYSSGTEDGALKKTYNKVIQRKIKMLKGMKDSGIEISAEDDKWLQEHTGQAHGGRIGYNMGGIDTPFQGIGALNPRMGYQNAGEVGAETTDYNTVPYPMIREKMKSYADMTGSDNIYDIIEVATQVGDKEFVDYLRMNFTHEGFTGVEDPAFSTASGALGAAYGGRIGAQSGGILPLLNMGGMEKDYRQDGGFVPIGRKEKADDVPARLSKNEFVFTADAVRAAGGGDIDQGAQRMYNVMKNLEAGGDISEQSQGKA